MLSRRKVLEVFRGCFDLTSGAFMSGTSNRLSFFAFVDVYFSEIAACRDGWKTVGDHYGPMKVSNYRGEEPSDDSLLFYLKCHGLKQKWCAWFGNYRRRNRGSDMNCPMEWVPVLNRGHWQRCKKSFAFCQLTLATKSGFWSSRG